jgi:hypothetical protein
MPTVVATRMATIMMADSSDHHDDQATSTVISAETNHRFHVTIQGWLDAVIDDAVFEPNDDDWQGRLLVFVNDDGSLMNSFEVMLQKLIIIKACTDKIEQLDARLDETLELFLPPELHNGVWKQEVFPAESVLKLDRLDILLRKCELVTNNVQDTFQALQRLVVDNEPDKLAVQPLPEKSSSPLAPHNNNDDDIQPVALEQAAPSGSLAYEAEMYHHVPKEEPAPWERRKDEHTRNRKRHMHNVPAKVRGDANAKTLTGKHRRGILAGLFS